MAVRTAVLGSGGPGSPCLATTSLRRPAFDLYRRAPASLYRHFILLPVIAAIKHYSTASSIKHPAFNIQLGRAVSAPSHCIRYYGSCTGKTVSDSRLIRVYRLYTYARAFKLPIITVMLVNLGTETGKLCPSPSSVWDCASLL